MIRKAILVTVRSSSTRLPEKCFLRFGEETLIEHVIARAQNIEMPIIVCTTDKKSDDKIVEICISRGVSYFRGDNYNKIKRWMDCCEQYQLDSIHTVDADDPFFCVTDIVKSLKILDSGYDIVKPSDYSSAGGATVGYSIRKSALQLLIEGTMNGTDTEMINPYIEMHPELRITKLVDGVEYERFARMTLDYWEDYIFLSSLKCLSNKVQPEKIDIDNVLRLNPELVNINMFRNEEWKKRQEESESNARV